MPYIPLSQRKTTAYPQVGDPVAQAMASIGKLESSSNYEAVGPDTGSGNKALGKYQIMQSNIPSWSKEVLGREVTEDEFLSSPEIQDQIARGKMSESFQKYGNLDDVASVWFTGRPYEEAGEAVADVTGTSNDEYLRRFRSGLGQKRGYIPLSQRQNAL